VFDCGSLDRGEKRTMILAKGLAIALLLYGGIKAASWLIRSVWSQTPRVDAENPGDAAVREMFRDPVCGVYISGDTAVSALSRGRRVYFCSDECRRKFLDGVW
jgi:YHS domain-containing protein